MEKYDVIAIAEASRCSSNSHEIQAEYFVLSGINNFTCEGLGPIECYILNKYKDPELLKFFTLSGNGTRTIMSKKKETIFIPTDYYQLYVKHPRMLELIPKIIADNLEIDIEGKVIKYNLANTSNMNQREDIDLHHGIHRALNNTLSRVEFMKNNVVEFIESSRLFILGYSLELGEYGFGKEIRRIKGDKFISIGIGVTANFQLNFVRVVYSGVPPLKEHLPNLYDPENTFMIDDAYKYLNLSTFEKSLVFTSKRKSIFVWTKTLKPSATFHQFPWGISPPIVGSILRLKKNGGEPTLKVKKYKGYETPVHIYDALIMLNESLYNGDVTI